MNSDIAVSVICITYNHEKYIRQCLESLVCQKTSFRYEIIVHDDCSTDGTVSIIREFELKYPDLVKTIYQKENQFQRGGKPSYIAAASSVGQYLAYCEGDDYWCDEHKLQLQYDYMKTHPDCSLCFHNTATLYDAVGRIEDQWFFWKDRSYKGEGTYSSRELVALNVIPFSAMMFRKEYRFQYQDAREQIHGPIYGDMAKTLFLAEKGYGYCIGKTMSVYRRDVYQSAMAKIYTDLEHYNRGIFTTINTMQWFDAYSEYKYHDILGKQIADEENKFLQVDLSAVESGEYKDKKTYIYGTGIYGAICASELMKKGICFDGFVVSDGQEKDATYVGYPVFFLSEIEDMEALMLVAVGAKLRPVLLNNLAERGFTLSYAICKEGKKKGSE